MLLHTAIFEWNPLSLISKKTLYSYVLRDCLSVFKNVNNYSVQQKQLYPYSIGCSKPGVFGIKCDIPCPNNCRYRTCHIKNGTCFGCAAGYKGTFCETGIVVFEKKDE